MILLTYVSHLCLLLLIAIALDNGLFLSCLYALTYLDETQTSCFKKNSKFYAWKQTWVCFIQDFIWRSWVNIFRIFSQAWCLLFLCVLLIYRSLYIPLIVSCVRLEMIGQKVDFFFPSVMLHLWIFLTLIFPILQQLKKLLI